MRDDLLPAQASIDWAEAQIVTMQDRFIGWQRSGPYQVETEPDTERGGQFVVARQFVPLHSHIQVDAGMVVHAIRTSLDILMGILAARNGKASGKHPHFPVRRTVAEWSGHVARDIEIKGWLTNAQVAAIEAAGPYPGGDGLLFTLHHLDIMSKHQRLLTVYPEIQGNWLSIWGGGAEPHWRVFDDKTILYRLAPGVTFTPTQGNIGIAGKVTVNEPTLGLNNEEAFNLLRRYVAKATEVIALFDGL